MYELSEMTSEDFSFSSLSQDSKVELKSGHTHTKVDTDHSVSMG